MAEYRGVDNVARNVIREYRGVNNVARAVAKAYRGVANVARQYLGFLDIFFRVPTWNNQATVDEEFAGFDNGTIRLSFKNAVKASDADDYVCRVYITTNKLFDGQTISFEYKIPTDSAGYTEIQYWDENAHDIVTTEQLFSSSFTSYSRNIPTGTYRITIGWWCKSSGSGEMIIKNMTIGDEQII